MSRDRLQTIQALSHATDRYEQTGERSALEALVAARFALRRPRAEQPKKRPKKRFRETLRNFRIMEPYLARTVREWPATQVLEVPPGGRSPFTIRDNVHGAIKAFLLNSTNPHWQPRRCLGYTRCEAEVLFPTIRLVPGNGALTLKTTLFRRKPLIPEINVSSPDKGELSARERRTLPGADRRALVSVGYLMDGGYFQDVVWVSGLAPEDEEILKARFDVEITESTGGVKGMRPLNDFERMKKTGAAA